jgi:anti-anti-sigma regulatory factor
VVFSFFKKDGKDGGRPGAASGSGRPAARATGKPGVKPVGKPLPSPAERSLAKPLPSVKFATTENAVPAKDLARSLAMETAAKIDAIESEMARDFLRPAANTGSPMQGPTTGGPKPAKPAPAAAAPTPAADALDPGTDPFLGNINAIDVNTSGAGSVIDETAILFANGQADEAEATMRNGIETDTIGHNRQTAWRMLFELVNLRGDAAAFEQLTMQYALRFENSSPAWMNYAAASPMAPPPLPAASGSAMPTVRLPETIDAQIVKALEQLKALAAQHAALTLDVSAARSIDLVGAELLLRVVNAFKRSNHELTVVGAEQLLDPLRAALEPGRRDATDAMWMLWLEVLRLLGRQADFEETGIQYCITFEVSPPSWEPAPPSLRTRAASATAAAPVPTAAVDAYDPLDWRGEIEREGEPYFGRLAIEAREKSHLTVECQYLRRMAFSTATALLTLLMKLQAAGVRVEFANVNPLVAALFHLLGISAIAGIQPRRA